MIDTLKRLLKLSPIALTKNHRYDKQTKKIIDQLSNNSNCIDVGCYKGEILDLMINAAPNGKHFGIEPIPVQYEFLSNKYNNQDNCTILNFAASNKKGNSTFNYVISNPSYSGLKKRDYDSENEKDTTIHVKTVLLDDTIPKDIKIDLIKIDVEGAELLVLEGASNIISRDQPIVIFEHGLGASEYYGSNPQKIYEYFSEKGMTVSNLGNYLLGNAPLSFKEFEQQYIDKKNYYFIAHTSK